VPVTKLLKNNEIFVTQSWHASNRISKRFKIYADRRFMVQLFLHNARTTQALSSQIKIKVNWVKAE